MSTKTRMTNRMVSLALTTALATVTLSGCTGNVAPPAHASAAKAETAIEKGQVSKAVTHAEAAVLAAPRDAATRTLLASTYLEAGRFVSAATTFSEAVELGDTSPRTVVSLALAQIASGQQAASIATLEQYKSVIDPADYGLAISLAGRPQEGVHVLGNLLRGGHNTVKVRQNLAYAYALQGDWRRARLMAAEDVPADQIGERMAHWSSMSRPEFYHHRVADLIGVPMVADAGQPAMLALSNHDSVEMLVAEAAADSAPVVAEAPRGELPAVALAASSPAPAETAAAPARSGSAPVRFSQSRTAKRSETPAPAAAPAAAPAPVAAPRQAGIRFVKKAVVQDVPATPAPRRAASPTGPARSVAAAQPLQMESGNYRIQLGSYFSMSDAQAAWKVFLRRHPELDGAEKVITKARVKGRIYYRVAAGGFARSSALNLCGRVKQGGAGCIAYAADRPLPGTLESDVRVAAR